MSTSYVAGAVRDVVWSEQRDCGGMFDAEVGVWREEGGFVAYVKGEWGGGINSKRYTDEETARANIGRLWEKYYGDGDLTP